MGVWLTMPKWKVNSKLTYYVKYSTANKIRLAYEYLVGFGDRVPISFLNQQFKVPPEWIERLHVLGVITVESKFNYFSFINAKNPITYYAKVANMKKAKRLFNYIDKRPQKAPGLKHGEVTIIDRVKLKIQQDEETANQSNEERYTDSENELD